ncbi:MULTISPECIES: LLM class flavin-dependent oxidoreductase [Saccharopolyspora]|uniref:LLM class flavin-dependent oxidoreductase n=1 Tax=Saccharopolyspora gregorii TaxID=33914 RepID=A0ABP6RQL0_9PSEU|nr:MULTISPECIES: LLM class flavin-dependent oxidoreductase [unclassified Saccharopolyspora]MCA1184868.1 LLM class flavin-dependent oxidoreductase [Saccharopolyspora sp. 6T]MCA1190593.1 LLM class flavin-dependent oxidoreductase [Saccharopolyspora sp. 6V]MCA1226463.1 LLM class flavin-dependent oxidoreductase [Saccharopolyspora sp. 6M]MCA1283084.1 LLM class flavin-dependent oxidoreductase [Saccharopolyspora sp. 7B]
MRFSIFHNLGAPGRFGEYDQVMNETREFARYADQAGFWSIWYTEHHFGHEGYELIANPVLMGADIAARTENIRIGQAANIATFWHPLRLAEDIAQLDQLSGGRVEVGLGRGLYGREALNLNTLADPRDQEQNRALFDETVEILQKAWSNEFFSHDGRFYTFPAPGVRWEHPLSPATPEFTEDGVITKLAVTPRPYQRPHPPLWQVIDSPRSIQTAAQQGVQGLFWLPPISALKDRFQLYKDSAQAAGRDLALGEGIGLVRDVFVADTMEQARAQFEEALLTSYKWITHWRGLGNLMEAGEELTDAHELSFEFLEQRNLLVGTPEHVAGKIEELQEELNLEHLLLWTTHPGLRHEHAMRSLELFTEKVMPRFQGSGS